MRTISEHKFTDVFINNLKINTRSLAVRTLLSDRNLRKINYKPYYQRNYVWDNAKASFFIESVLLGTEIPPLVLFKSGQSVEVIDGRQRFETLKNFMQNDFKLANAGLMKLRNLKNQSFNKLDDSIKEVFLSSKIRIFEFEVVNKPNLYDVVEDKVKREIFRRYNTGITPLKAVEVDNAKYDKDSLSNLFKDKLKEDHDFFYKIKECFFHKARFVDTDLLTHIVNFFRRYIALSRFPIKSYASGNNRTEFIDLLYDSITEESEDFETQYKKFKKKLDKTLLVYDAFKNEERLQSRLIYECILWAISVLENEEIEFNPTKTEIASLKSYYLDRLDSYSIEDSHHYKHIVARFSDTATIFNLIFNVDFSLYFKNENFTGNINELRSNDEQTELTSEDFSNLRVHKPDPTSVPIDEIISELQSHRFLIRPSYQRLEKINRAKSSSIIESILLGVYLPPIFLYKRSDGIKEVVDGQQRLLSILGYMGKQYMDEKGELSYSKNNNFALKDMSILKNIEKKKFHSLEEYQRDKIFDFDLSIIEIDGKINPNFDPIDLFIRLNQKPYPIKNNSFEMWNSEIDREIAQLIKSITNEHIEWFYIRQRNPTLHQDRMLNEEMNTILSYLDYTERKNKNSIDVFLFYTKEDRLNCRIKEKRAISAFLTSLEDSPLDKVDFAKSINNIKDFIKNLSVLIKHSTVNGDIINIFNVKQAQTYTRSLQDFYIIWYLIGSTPLEVLENNKEQVLNDIRRIFSIFKNIQNQNIDDKYLEKFLAALKECRNKYSI